MSIEIRRIQSEPQLPSSPNARATAQFRPPVGLEHSSTDIPAHNSAPPTPVTPAPDTQAQVNQNTTQVPDTRSPLTRLLAFFGIGGTASHARKSLVSVVWNLAWGLAQVTVITVVLILAGVLFKNPRNTQVSEWKACSRPLGVWASLWVARVLLASGLAYWEFRRDRILHPPTDAETTPNFQTGTPTAPPANDPGTGPPQRNTNNTTVESPTLKNSILYSRLTLLSSLITLSWFLTAHVLAYTSIETCRYTSPHLWWLVFGIMCILYLMILEVVVLGFVVLIIAPILFILWNIILICLGRHPMQNPGVITPDVGKLSKAVVDKIPLAIYIPAPPPSEAADGEKGLQSPHIYPPKASDGKPGRTRFRMLRNLSSFTSAKKGAQEKVLDVKAGNTTSPSWFDNWEKAEFPFVTLEGNRATCAICLMDFEEPKRKENEKDQDEVEKDDETQEERESEVGVISELAAKNEDTNQSLSQVEDETVVSVDESTEVANLPPISQEVRDRDLKLSDAGEGAQPLRLLECGHAFHKTCVDPWFTDVSGRCPVCQRAVVEPKSGKSRRA